MKLVWCHLRITFIREHSSHSNIFDGIIAQFRTTSSRGDEDEEDDEETMRGLQDLLLPVIQSAVAFVLDKGVLFRTEMPTTHRTQAGLIDRNEWCEVLDRLADRSSFNVMPVFPRGARVIRVPWTQYTSIFNISQFVYCSDPLNSRASVSESIFM